MSVNVSYVRCLISAAARLALVLACASGVQAAEVDSTPSRDLADLSLEELMELKVTRIVTASRFEQLITEAPAHVTVVTADEIRKNGYRTLADVIRAMPGLYVTYDRNYSYIGIRGFGRHGDYNGRILLLIDGHRMNDTIFDTAFLGTEFPLDIDLVETVELVRGPGSSLYGSNAFFGVLNIITRQAKEVRREAAVSAGSYDSWKGRVSYGGHYDNGLDVLVSGSLLKSAGQPALYYPEYASAPNGGEFRNNDYDTAKSAYTRLTCGDVTLSALYGSREKGVPTGAYDAVFNTRPNYTLDNRGYVDVSYKHAFSSGVDVAARAFIDDYSYEGRNTYDKVSGQPYVITRDLAHAGWWGGELVSTLMTGDRHRFSIGSEFRSSLITTQSNLDVSPAKTNLDYNHSASNWGIFAQSEYNLLKTLLLNAGVRYDDYDRFSSVNPRAALIWRPVPAATYKLVYGEAFRAPNAYETYYNDGGKTSKSDPDLKPEKIRTYEAIAEHYFNKVFNSTVAAFYYRINNLITLVTDPADNLLVYRNIERVEAKGVDVTLQAKLDNGLLSRVSYTWQEATNLDGGAWLVNSPKHLAKVNLSIPLGSPRFFISPELQYTGPRSTLAGQRIADKVIANLTLSGSNLLPGLDASFSVYNLFDTGFDDPGSSEHKQDTLRQDGSNFRFKLSYRF